MPSDSNFFEKIPCPGCGGIEFQILKTSKYPASISLAELKAMFSASSDHVLLDQVVRCAACSLVYVNPRLRPEIITEGYSLQEDTTFVAQNEDRIRTFEKNLRQLLKHLRMEGKGKRILDVGCAGGAFPVAARECGFDVVGVEPSRWMADFGRRTYGLDIRDGLLLPGMFAPGEFDVITLWDVIEHVPEPHETLRLIHLLLKPGGLLIVNYPDIGSVAARLLGGRWPFWLSVHLLYFTRRTIARQLTRAGFDPISYRPYWQTLPLGYVLRRALPYFKPVGIFLPVLRALRAEKAPLTYNIGQTCVVAKSA